MIAYLKGKILEKSLSYIILCAGGPSASGGENQAVGYKVFVTPEVLSRPVGEEIQLYTYLKSPMTGRRLFGLQSFSDLQFFELLITVSRGGAENGADNIVAATSRAIKAGHCQPGCRNFYSDFRHRQ